MEKFGDRRTPDGVLLGDVLSALPPETRLFFNHSAGDGCHSRQSFAPLMERGRRMEFVSCIMPTYNRSGFVPDAIAYFLRQDLSTAELIIIDDGTEPVQTLIPEDSRLRYVRLSERRPLGAKRNLACEIARGEIIAHWDDDDWYSPDRLRRQAALLTELGASLCGLDTVLFYDLRSGEAWRYIYPPHERPWLAGNSLMYRRTFWSAHRFPEIDVGEDTLFIWSAQPQDLVRLPDPRIHVGIIHGGNASPKQIGGPWWQAYPVEDIRKLLGNDWCRYAKDAVHRDSDCCSGFVQGVGIAAEKPLAPEPDDSVPERMMSMITLAQESDLALPEYVAFNQAQSLPRMRRWELPFAVFQSRLSNSMAVLDCTINPVTFRERLASLYEHVLYRHWNPIQSGEFCLPFGVPDGAFDRVICINTLEHLLRPQRKLMVADMARKLKPGGWLILTCDFYFDSFWQDSAFLESGVMRADGEEVFNGFNKVTPAELLELANANGLFPFCKRWNEPSEIDPTLYRQDPPFPHACMAAMFGKGAECDLPPGKKIVLALLSWNTRDVTLDSLRAYIKEARMLRRLGQHPFICICDNGSSDGTAMALQACESEIEGPHRFIFNHQNEGNSIGRNQIIEFTQEVDADYVLFMDGDIEIVPFSSFAMLRHMENSGVRLGCIGACSAGQTPHRHLASSDFYNIDHVETTNLVAWTQYGMFRREIFDDGIRFDDTSPFTGPGWGFEDNDFAFQMDAHGYINQRFFGMTYLHRDMRSSIRIMRELGIDARAIFEKRKQRVLEKWSEVSRISNGPLLYVRSVDCSAVMPGM